MLSVFCDNILFPGLLALQLHVILHPVSEMPKNGLAASHEKKRAENFLHTIYLLEQDAYADILVNWQPTSRTEIGLSHSQRFFGDS